MINATLVTIHGFWSSPATWDRLNAVWSADEQLRGLRIHPFEYPSPKKPRLPFSGTRVPDYDDIAQTLATEYTVELAEAADIAIVTHSQGGLILQRFLAWMLQEGQGQELVRIRTIVMLACPNGGSEYLRSLRHILGYGRHAQASNLEVLNRQVAYTQRTVLQRIVNATGVDDHQCRIPFHVYAGNSDRVVTAASAQGAFPGASVLAGNHTSILDPTSPGNRTAQTVKHHLLTDLPTSPAQPGRQVPSVPGAPSDSASAPFATDQAALPSAPLRIRLMREQDKVTNQFRLGALNRGTLGLFRAEVISIRTQDGQVPVVSRNGWPIPWLDDASVTSKDIPTAGRPLLDFAHFNLPNLQGDLEGTKWLNGNHWTFPSLPAPVTVSYSAVRMWSEQDDHYFIVTVRVIRDDPPGFSDAEFTLGTDGQEPYCREYTSASSPPGNRATGELVPGPANIDRWRSTTEDISTDLMQLQNNAMSHPAYSNRSPQEQPPASVRVGVIISCEELGQDTPTTSSIRAAFLRFLSKPEIMYLVSDLTDVVNMTWRPRDENPRFNFGAVLASDDETAAPAAWARLLLPESWTHRFGRDNRYANLVVYVEPRTVNGAPTPPASLTKWRQRFAQALQMPCGLASFLTSDLGLATSSDPAAEIAVWLKAHGTSLTELVDIGGITVIPGSPQTNWFMTFAVANPSGQQEDDLAGTWLAQMCDSALHLDGHEST
jgi:pimeloyl-ACP methyl ester carboxylesterase